jgi:hypothetical protein
LGVAGFISRQEGVAADIVALGTRALLVGGRRGTSAVGIRLVLAARISKCHTWESEGVEFFSKVSCGNRRPLQLLPIWKRKV